MLYERTAISKKPESLIRNEIDALRGEDQLSPVKAALEIIETPSICLSLGNSLLFTSDYKKALTIYQAAVGLYRKNKDKARRG